MICPDESAVASYIAGRLKEMEAVEIDAHIDRCTPCRELVAVLAGSTRDADPEAPPKRFGRYVVIGRLGEGAMGLVLSAYDPQLDRSIALKLVRPQVWGSASENAQARLLAEARALAKLSHPNVVTVHDSGTVDD